MKLPAAVVPSLLDRLIDFEPDKSRDPSISVRQQINKITEGVRRDLEYLLNTRQYYLAEFEHLAELSRSLVDYGLPDFMSQPLASDEAKITFANKLEKIIHRYEPRLARVRVLLSEKTNNNDRTLDFRISAVLLVEPAPEPLLFDSNMDMATYNFSVKIGD